MSFKTLVSPIAVATAATLALSSVALAQTTVGEVEVTEADMPAVTEYCETLADADMTADGMETDPMAADDANTEAMPAGDGAADMTAEEPTAEDTAMASDAPDSGDTTDAGAENVDQTLMTDAITIEDCQDAGIIE